MILEVAGYDMYNGAICGVYLLEYAELINSTITIEAQLNDV